MADASHRLAEFEEVALPHRNDLYRTATRLLGEPERAADVVQEVYLLAWKSFHRFEQGTNCRAWLFKILINAVHHHRRKWFRLRQAVSSEEILALTEAPTPLADRMTDQSILNALDSLSIEFRTVVLLADVEEFTYREVAAMLDVPIGTVMSRLSRARGLLRKQLADTARQYGVRKGEPA